MKTLTDLCYNEQTAQMLDIYLPECDSFPVFVYIHGGGMIKGDKSRALCFAQYMTDRGIAVVSVNYRLYPTATYPDFLTDCAEGVAWAYRNMGQYGAVTGFFVGGSSAGGYITQMLCFDKSWLAAVNMEPMDITAFIHDAGQPTCHFNVLKYRGLDSRRIVIDETAPLYHVGKDEQYPPMLILVSDDDMENRYEQTMLLMSTLKHFGLDGNAQLKVMHGTHCHYIPAVDDNGDSVFGRIAAEYIRSISEKV